MTVQAMDSSTLKADGLAIRLIYAPILPPPLGMWHRAISNRACTSKGTRSNSTSNAFPSAWTKAYSAP
jgi:hypothetical protein